MTSGASAYWRAARRGVKLYDGLPVINEAQYVLLMFEQKCTVSMRAHTFACTMTILGPL